MNYNDYVNYDWLALAEKVYTANHRWWHDLQTNEKLDRNPKQLLALIVSEASEALEGLRKKRNDDHLTHRKMFEVEIADHLIRVLDFIVGTGQELGNDGDWTIDDWEAVKDNVLDDEPSAALWDLNVELVMINEVGGPWKDYIMLICAFSEKFDIDLMGALVEKMEYNLHREDHKKESRLADGGKAF